MISKASQESEHDRKHHKLRKSVNFWIKVSVEKVCFILCPNELPESEVCLSTNIMQTYLKYFEIHFVVYFLS